MCICISCFGRSGVYCMYQEIGTDASPAEMVTDLPQVGVFTALLLVKPSDAVLLLLQGSLMIRCLASAVQKARSLPALLQEEGWRRQTQVRSACNSTGI